MNNDKRLLAQYDTVENPFDNIPFKNWAKQANIAAIPILEPFAGRNHLIEHLQKMDLCKLFMSYDINPRSKLVYKKDTLACFPLGFEVCITNPPWLARNSATARNIAFPKGYKYNDVYKIALENCLTYCGWVAALVPESFIRCNDFRERLDTFISLPQKIFHNTENPVGLALFTPHHTADVNIWSNNTYIGLLTMLEATTPRVKENGCNIRFNDINGNVGLFAVDNTREESIRFCPIEELSQYNVKNSSRYITKIHVDGNINIEKWNTTLKSFRNLTQDVLMTSCKGIRKDGKYRRRCHWELARGIIHY